MLRPMDPYFEVIESAFPIDYSNQLKYLWHNEWTRKTRCIRRNKYENILYCMDKMSCRFTVRIWKLALSWLGIHDIHPKGHSLKSGGLSWFGQAIRRRGIGTLAMLISGQIWNEWNARVVPPCRDPTILSQLKEEPCLWQKAGTEHLSFMIPGE